MNVPASTEFMGFMMNVSNTDLCIFGLGKQGREVLALQC